jgi:hypothetical protein
MTAAQSGSFQEDHAGTARLWDEQIARRGLALAPFSWRVSSLVDKTCKAEVDALRNGSPAKLQTRPVTKSDALGAAASYLSGSAKWYARKTEGDLKGNRAFKALGVTDFRSKDARALRDVWFKRRPIGFLHQAARYRGKANYREALFLAYGANTEATLSGFLDDMYLVLRAFLAMAGAFGRRKLGDKLWADFVSDVDLESAFKARATDVWS